MTFSKTHSVLKYLDHNYQLDQLTVLTAITTPASAEAAAILHLADVVRQKSVGPEVHLRGLIEFSNYCRNNCLYCGLRRDNRQLTRYRMTPTEIVDTAAAGVALGYQTVVLQSGEDLFFSSEILAEVIKSLRALNLVVTLSIGEREPKEYALWQEAGAQRYLMRHETADPELYNQLHPGQRWQKRIDLLKTLKDLNYQVGSGFMVGLPGQSPETLLTDLALIQELDAEMIGIGPFIPHPATPLGQCQQGDFRRTLVMVALTRLIQPEALIPATTALGSIHPTGREAALEAGANVVMPNLTPCGYRPSYEIYPHKICLTEAAEDCRGCISRRIEKSGRTIATGCGHNPTWLRRQTNG